MTSHFSHVKLEQEDTSAHASVSNNHTVSTSVHVGHSSCLFPLSTLENQTYVDEE